MFRQIAFFFFLVIVVLFPFQGKGQWYTVTNLSGTSAPYGSTTVGVLGGGTFNTYFGWCGASPYWIGAFTSSTPDPGWYTFSFSPPANSVRIFTTASDPGESIAIKINGVHYSLTAANLIAWASTCGTTIMTLSGDSLLSIASNSSSELLISYCPINTIEVETDGLSNGTVFTFMFSDSGSCLNAVNNSPCLGDTLKLDGLGDSTGAIYYWTGPGGFTSTLQDPFIYPALFTDSGVYRVIRISGTLIDTSYTDVKVHPKPVLTLASNAPLCTGMVDTLNLSVLPDSTGEAFSWTGPNGFTSSLEFPFIDGFLPVDVGIYTVVATSSFGCKDTATINVGLAPVPPTPVISGTTTYCTGQTFVPFTVAATGTVLWYSTRTGGVGSAIPPVINTAVAGTTTWWATQTILGCESLRDSITVVVHPTPAAPVVTGTTVYCQYFPYILPVVTGNNILWYTTATGGTGSVVNPVVNTNIPGVYNFWVTQTDTGCESPRTPFTVTVNPKPVPPVIIDNPGNYCPGQAFVPFTIVSGINILWYNSAIGGTGSGISPGVNTTVPGTYTFWATQTVLGCESDRVPVSVTVYDNVTSGFTYQVKYGCKADTVDFLNSSTGALNYSWSFGDVTPISLAVNPVHVYLLQAIDTVKLISSSANCADSSVQYINLLHPIHAEFTEDSNIICQGKRVIFTDGSTGTGKSYLWSFGDGSFSSVTNPVHSYLHEGVYKVFEVVTDFVPCTDTAFTTISVDTISPIHMGITDTVICRGTYVTFTGNYSTIGNTGITWTMGNGEIFQNLNPLVYAYQTTGTYTVTAAVTYRVCPDTEVSRKITIIPAPEVNLGPDTSICKGGQPILLVDEINKNTRGASWEWSTGQTGPAISVYEPGTYSVVVKIEGCPATYTVNVDNDCYINIPNVFTPNGDGINDYFFPRNLLTSGLISFKMDIYNRWGQLLFESTSTEGRGWDGKLNNADQPEGVYVYVIDATFKDGQAEHHQGNITLIR